MPKKSIFKKRGFWLTLTAIFALIIIVGGYFYNKITNTRISVAKGNSTVFYIAKDETYTDVLEHLTQQGIVSDYSLFDFLAQRANYPNKVKAGRYLLKKGETYINVIRQLRSGKQEEVKLVINAMITPTQLAAIVGKNLVADSIVLINMLEDSSYLEGYGFNKYNALCMFIPNTYNFYWDTDGQQFMMRMKKEYNRFWTKKRLIQADAIGLTPIEVGILASIVDGETNKTDEMSIVAGLYLNRLNKGIMLQADPTVKFALRNSAKQRVYEADLKVESPYNTYLHTGLPPGPLALPSQQAIEAVLSPSKHDYIYMCAKEDLSGYHNFATTLTQHNLNAARYRLALDKLGIR